MKKIMSFILLFALLLSAFGCGEQKYPPVESTKEEAEVIMTFDFEGERYDVKYELYRHFFLTFKEAIDLGDSSVWSSDSKDVYLDRINDLIINAAAEIFSTLHHARKLGIDPYSSKVDKKIEEMIYSGVNGQMSDKGGYLGFDGDYDAYLASLTEMYLNYSAHVLLYRYACVWDLILAHYMGTGEDDLSQGISEGALKYTKNDVFDFYYGDESARVLLTTLDTRSFTEARANEIKEKIASFDSTDEVKEYIVNFTATVSEDAMKGVIIGKYSLNGDDFQKVADMAISMEQDSVSPVMKVTENYTSFYYILYKTEKSGEYYEENYDRIEEAYVSNEIGKLLSRDKAGIKATAGWTEAYEKLDPASIKMP